MASTPKQVNDNTKNNNSTGKRKKSRGKHAYLSKWLDKTLHHTQELSPSMETYESFTNPNLNYSMSNNHFGPVYDPYRFNMYGTNEPMSLPTLPTYYNPTFSNVRYPEYRYMQGVNKNMQVPRSRQRRRNENKPEELDITPNGTLNGANFTIPKTYSDSQDFASLPPIVTSVGDTNSNSDMNANEKNENGNSRRYSDPCVQGLPDVARPANREPESDSDGSSELSGSQVGTKLITCLLDQITSLKIANERLNRDLIESKAELNNIRQQNALWQNHAHNPSVGGTPVHSPLNNNGLMTSHYSPGYLTELVREVRDASRVREEAMYSRVRAMVMERTENGFGSSDAKFTEKTLEDIKSTLRATEADKRRMMDRIMKLEEELRVLRVANGVEVVENGVTNGGEDDEAERIRMRKEVAEMRKAKQNAEEHALKLERLVTQLRSKFNGLQISPSGPESLTSDHDHDTNTRARRTSVNSNGNTVVFGPVTDL